MMSRAPLIEFLEPRRLLSAYFVSPSGNDTGDGSASAPWKTLQHAADSVVAGDSVTVRPGRYVGFHLEADGAASARIIFTAEAGVIIDTRNATTPDGINLEGADYVTIEGFRVENTTGSITRAGIRSVINTDAILRNNVCDQNGRWGIFTGFSENILIENNETSRSVLEHGIYVSNSADNPIVRGNRSWGNRSNGLHFNGDASQGGDGMISNALIENNVIYSNGAGGGSGINCDGVTASVIRHNLLYDNHASGISLYRIDAAAGSSDNLVANNTVIMASNARWCLNIRDASTGNRVVNNIFYNYHSYRGAMTVDADCLPGFESDYNAVIDRFTTTDGDSVVTLAQWRSATGQDAHSFVATPDELFTNVVANDYTLAASSPARNTGENGVDLGAFDEGDVVPTPNPNPEPQPQPNPAPTDAVTALVESGVLVIRGTAGNDDIRLTPVRGRQILVTSTGVSLATIPARDVKRIVAIAGEGNDRIVLAPSIKLPAALHGGAGDDTLAGGRSHDLLFGGAGADDLQGNAGCDLVAADDAGIDSNDLVSTLAQLSLAWNSARSYGSRINAIRDDLDIATTDGAIDTLVGGAGNDWFLAGDEDPLSDRARRERVN